MPYFKYSKIDSFYNSLHYYDAVYFNDGSLLVMKMNIGDVEEFTGIVDFFFYPNAKNYNKEKLISRKGNGKTYFSFQFAPSCNSTECKFLYKQGFEPYKYNLEEITKESLTNTNIGYGCDKDAAYNLYCTALIQYNNWKIPDDYPFKVN